MGAMHGAGDLDRKVLAAVERLGRALRAARQHVATLHELSLLALPAELGDTEDLGGLVDLVVLAIQGLVLDDMAAPDQRAGERLLATIHALVDAMFGPPAG